MEGLSLGLVCQLAGHACCVQYGPLGMCQGFGGQHQVQVSGFRGQHQVQVSGFGGQHQVRLVSGFWRAAWIVDGSCHVLGGGGEKSRRQCV